MECIPVCSFRCVTRPSSGYQLSIFRPLSLAVCILESVYDLRVPDVFFLPVSSFSINY